MKVREIMNQRVVAVRVSDTLGTAIAAMLDHRVSGVPVLDAAGHLAGILTEGDLLRRAELGTDKRRPRWLAFIASPGAQAERFVHEQGRTVGEVMTRDVVTIGGDAPLASLVKLMEAHRIKRVPVVSRGRVVGIVTRADLMRALLTVLERPPAARPASDADLRRTIVASLRKQRWAPRTLVDVDVHDGVVTLSGTIFDEREREALRVIVENTSGVRGYRDDLTWIEPMSGMVLLPPDQVASETPAAD